MKIWKSESNLYYPDIPFFLVAIPFISAINYYLTYSRIQLNAFLFITFTIDTVTGYIAVWGVRQLILYLDKVFPYRGQIGRRIALQVITTTLVGLFIISAFTELSSLIAHGRSAKIEFYTFDLLIISIWFFAINGFYIMMYFYRQWRRSENSMREQEEAMRKGLLVRQGNKDIKLDLAGIRVLQVEGEYTQVVDNVGKKYLLYQSLSELEERLPTGFFFRVNRQTIVSRQAISGYKRLDHGRLEVLLADSSFGTGMTVSREKAAAFKRWFRPESGALQG